MEVFRAGEMLFRSQASACLPFRAPSAYGRVQPQRRAIEAVSRRSRTQCQTPRPFSTSHPGQADDSTSPAEHDRRPTSGGSDDISSILDTALDFNKGTSTAPATRTSRFKSNTAQPSNPISRLAGAYEPKKGSSVDDLFEAMRRPAGPSGGRIQQSGARSGGLGSFMDIAGMLDPNNMNQLRSPTGTTGGPPAPTFVEKTLPMKLGPSVGRTVAVNEGRGMDVGRAFRSLEIQCARNSVRRDSMRQRFHERNGLKRKRLASERWRRRFKENFRGVVKMVQKMKAQGW